MTRQQLEHLIRAACTIADDDEIIIIGSQSILASHPSAPAELLVSNEADVYPKNYPERADLIDGTIGELSPFHETYGYYAQGVGPSTAVLPRGWESRLVAIQNENTRWTKGLCLEPNDLVLSKYVAGREKDMHFARVAADHALVERDQLLERLPTMPITEAQRELVQARIDRDLK